MKQTGTMSACERAEHAMMLVQAQRLQDKMTEIGEPLVWIIRARYGPKWSGAWFEATPFSPRLGRDLGLALCAHTLDAMHSYLPDGLAKLPGDGDGRTGFGGFDGTVIERWATQGSRLAPAAEPEQEQQEQDRAA